MHSTTCGALTAGRSCHQLPASVYAGQTVQASEQRYGHKWWCHAWCITCSRQAGRQSQHRQQRQMWQQLSKLLQETAAA